MLKLGDKGEEVRCWERAINLPPTGDFDLDLHHRTQEFQRQHGLFADGIVGPKTWAAARGFELLAGEPCTKVAVRTGAIRYVIVHHSDTATRAGMVRALNAGAKPKSTHYSVDRDGSVAIHADPLDSTAWHCVGANLHGIGIDAIHRHGQPFPDVQVDAVGALLRWLCKIHGLPQVAAVGRFPTKGQLGPQAWGVAGHGQIQATQCPDGFPIAEALSGTGAPPPSR